MVQLTQVLEVVLRNIEAVELQMQEVPDIMKGEVQLVQEVLVQLLQFGEQAVHVLVPEM